MAVTGCSVLLLQTMTNRWCTCDCYRLQCVTVTDDNQQVVYVWLLQVTVCYCYRR